jgi:hypothetical protein
MLNDIIRLVLIFWKCSDSVVRNKLTCKFEWPLFKRSNLGYESLAKLRYANIISLKLMLDFRIKTTSYIL